MFYNPLTCGSSRQLETARRLKFSSKRANSKKARSTALSDEAMTKKAAAAVPGESYV
jgi:hypothetical protein